MLTGYYAAFSFSVKVWKRHSQIHDYPSTANIASYINSFLKSLSESKVVSNYEIVDIIEKVIRLRGNMSAFNTVDLEEWKDTMEELVRNTNEIMFMIL